MSGGDASADWEVGDAPIVSPTATEVFTAPESNSRRALARERYGRWAFTGVLGAFLALSLAGVFGVRSATSTASGGQYELRVSYATVTRPGVATPFEISVRRLDGAAITDPVTIAVSSDYLAMFDDNGLDPGPASETATADDVLWEFEPPGTDTLVVTLDARVEPAVQWGRDGVVRIVDAEGDGAEARIRTWVTP
jgi:hypothetical protein